jgi:DNA segregation ATPase FtsK/SpoIIIE-like protein
MIEPTETVFLGETSFRNEKVRFGIRQDDRRRHMYVVGSTGMGKSEFLKSMAIQDIEAGRGVCFIDPHGDTAEDLLDYVPEERIKDVIYFDPDDLQNPIAFNVMEAVGGFDYRHLVASGLLGVFKKIWGVEAWSGRMEYILNNTILALLEYPDSTLLGINRLMSSKDYRKKVVNNVKDPIVKAFWTDEFAKYADKFATEATAAIQNKVGQFASNNVIRNILGQSKSKIDIRKIMDEGKILIVNVSKGKIGEDASRLIGAFLITKIQLAAMSRVNIPEPERRDFYLYVDEFQNFATESFASILSEARKYHLSLVMAHQYIKQMEEHVMDAVFGNVGTIVSFRVGAEDAEYLEKWFQPDFMMNDIVNLGKRDMYLKLMIQGVSSKGFSATTLDRFPKLEHSNREAIIAASREAYSTPKDVVEKEIAEWAGPVAEELAQQEKRGDFRRDDRSQARSFNTNRDNENRSSSSYQNRPPMPRREERPYPPRREENRPQPRLPQNNIPVSKPQEVSLSALSSTPSPIDFKGRKIQEKPRNNRKEKVEVDTGELKKLLEESLKKKE